MPHLHLPTDHTDADLVMAANLADYVGSEELYVAWTQDRGPGVPEVEAVISDAPRPISPVAELIASLSAGCAAFWRALTGRPGDVAVREAPAGGGHRRTAEPSA
jgi:hypothetical protein